MKDGNFTFPIPLELLKEFQVRARSLDMSAARLLRQLVREFLKREEI